MVYSFIHWYLLFCVIITLSSTNVHLWCIAMFVYIFKETIWEYRHGLDMLIKIQ